MNLLICIGTNYKNFTPLNNFAQRFAKEQFGILDGIFFLESTKELENLQILLKDSTTQCLIVAPTAQNDGILKYLSHFFNNLKTQNLNSFIIKIQDSNLWLVDLEQLYLNKDIEQKEWNLNANKEKQLYLYPLNMDAESAMALLSGIARDFCINLRILNNCDNLEILLAYKGDLCGFKKAVKEMFLDGIFICENLAKSIIQLLESKNKTITAAESCTGGLIAHTLTKESGASAVFSGSVISYANEIKEAWLSVDSSHLAQFGAVSEAVVRDMLNGALHLSGADFALATSGVAGPTGGSKEKPIGTIYIGAKSKEGVEIIERLHFKGDRNFIQKQATLYAYVLFLKIFLKS